MNSDPKKAGSKSFIRIGLCTGIFLVLLFLKLGGFGMVANWSWWWVTAPLWAPTTLYVSLALIAAIAIRVTYMIRERKYRKKRESKKSYRIEE